MRRCLGCMRQYDEAYDVCPYCGYILDTPAKSKNHLSPGTVLQGRYTIGKVLGQGGFGITYIAWDQRLEKAVAIKEFFPNALAARLTGQNQIACFSAESQRLFEQGLQKMINESRVLARFSERTNVVQVIDCIESNGTAYIIMELLRGETVQSVLRREGQLPPERTMQIMLPILHALQAIHQTGLIHRDVSPENIFLCTDGRVKLLDFGAARIVSGMDNKTLSVMLKKGYAPIEQYSSHGKQGTYTDIYAVCATMYKMLTGVTPASSLDRIAKDMLLPVSHYTDVPPAIDRIILRGMAIEAADRIRTAGELSEALQSAMYEQAQQDGQATSADTPQPAVTQTVQTTHRLSSGVKTALALAAVALVVLLVIVVILALQLHNASTAYIAPIAYSTMPIPVWTTGM